jgi:hypothetical protein
MATPIVTVEMTAAAAAALVAIEEERRKLERARLELALGQAKLLHEREELAEEKAAFAREKANAGAFATGPTALDHASVASALEMKGGRLIVPSRVTHAWCCAFRTATRVTRGQVSPARRSQFLRVARLDFNVGRALDAQGIAFRWIRYVAYGVGAVQQHERVEQILRGEHPRSRPRESQKYAHRASKAAKIPERRRRK